MNNASEVPWQAWADTAEDAPEEPTMGSRRLLLAGAASGLALSASGLLPGWLEETKAREGAQGGKLGGRHGKNRRGRNRRKRRNRGNRKGNDRDQDKPRGGVFFLDGTKFIVEFAGPRQVRIDHYTYLSLPKNRWELQAWKDVAPGTSATFGSGSRAALWIDGRFWIEAETQIGFGSPAKLKIGSHGSIAANPIDWHGGTIVFDEQMDVGHGTPVFTAGSFATQVTRLDNDGPIDIFKVVAEALSS